MLVDTHCHIDLYNKPEILLQECERKCVHVIAMTNLPSHFELGLPFFRQSKSVRIALGLHPLYADKHKSEFDIFLKNIDKTSYIGEIGLDYSNEGLRTKELQLNSFEKVLQIVSTKKKILSIHSRKAEKEILELLIKYKIKNAIFHWYSGSPSLIRKILDEGYLFSINPSMINSLNGQNIISRISLNNILTESDGPFVQYNKKIVNPWDLKIVIDYIAETRKMNSSEVENQVLSNFYALIDKIR